MHTHKCAHGHTYAHTHTHTYTYKYTYTNKNTYTHIYTNAYTPDCTQTDRQTRKLMTPSTQQTIDDFVPRLIDTLALDLGVTPPQNEDQAFSFAVNMINDRRGKFLPPCLGMRACLVSLHSQGGIEKEDSLVGPPGQVSTLGPWKISQVRMNLLVYVQQAGGHTHSLRP